MSKDFLILELTFYPRPGYNRQWTFLKPVASQPLDRFRNEPCRMEVHSRRANFYFQHRRGYRELQCRNLESPRAKQSGWRALVSWLRR